MKKVLFAAMLLISLPTLVTSCGGSDDDEEQKQQPTANEMLIGTWKITKVQDFPLPLNIYELKGNNYVTFSKNGILEHNGEFNVVINGNNASPMTLPFTTYSSWASENTSDSEALAVYLGTKKDLYVGYIMSSTRIDLVKFAEDKTHGISYTLEK